MNKDEIKKFAFESYKRGRVDSLRSVIAGLSVLIGKEVEPPITVDDIVKKADKLLFMPDLFAYMLTGNKVCEMSIASTSQILNPSTKTWDKDVLNTFEIDEKLFPQLAQSATVNGVSVKNLLKLGTGGGVKLCALAAIAHVDFIYIGHQIQSCLLADVLVKGAAKVVGNVILAVGKCTCAAKTAHNGAALAADTALHAVAVNGATALIQRMTRLKHRHLQVGGYFCQLIGGENAAGAGADNDDIVIHRVHSCGNVLQGVFATNYTTYTEEIQWLA